MDKTDEQLAKILEKSLNVATKTGDFILDQAPDIIRQLILYKTVEKSIFIIISSVILYFAIKKMRKEFRKSDDFYDINPIISIGLPVVALIFSIALLMDVSILIKLIFAPKIYLIEYAANLLN